MHRRRVEDEGIVDREHDAVDAHLHHATQQRRIREVAAGGDVEVAAEGVAEAHGARGAGTRERLVDAPDQERQRFAEMAEHDLQARIGFEQAAEHETDGERRGLDRVAPGRAHHHREFFDVVVVIGIHHRRHRHRRMQVDRHVERLRALEDRPEALVVKKDAVGEPVDHRAFETELGGALELVGRRLRVAGGQRREGGEAFRVGGDDRIEPVVDAAGQRDRFRTGKFLCRRRAVGQDLHVDPGRVHLLDPQLAHVIKPLQHLRIARAFAADELRGQFLVPVVLLERDHLALRLLPHDACSHPSRPIVSSYQPWQQVSRRHAAAA